MLDYKTDNAILLQGIFTPAALAKIGVSKGEHVFVCEGRPDLEAGKSNLKELAKQGIVATIISDNMMGFLFFKGYLKKAFVACQYADNTGALCDTGALIAVVLAKHHKIPVQLLPAKRKTRFLGDPKSILSFEGKAI